MKLASITSWSLAFSYWIDKPWFLTEGKFATVLIIPSSWGSQLDGDLHQHRAASAAGRWLFPWPTQIVIPMTLAPETGKVSWDSMGLRRVLFLAEVNTRPSKSQGSSSG
jgi:hypothetical protein